ncbi:MAG: hypothetical protein K2P81_15610 [Bacteriovoracaceae bacterium]|nr:hypothetical protein [Bacteriovoracaceae bacterium]
MRELRASIDIGSNSVLLLIGQVSPFVELEKCSEVTGLGRGLDQTGVFMDIALDETFEALKNYGKLCDKHAIPREQAIVTATEASRVAKNAPEFYTRVKKELGFNVQIISGFGEASLTTKGILFNTNFESNEVVVMDIGGASTEFIRVNTKTFNISNSISLKVGAVRATDWLKTDTFRTTLAKIFSDNSKELDSFQTPVLHCVAGTMTSLANMHLGNQKFNEDEIHGLTMKRSDVEVLFRTYSDWSPEKFIEKFPFLGKRAGAIRGGLILTHHLLQRLNIEELIISTYGLRYGTFLEGKIANEYLA